MAKLTDSRKQFLHDVFTEALEGGINYWAGIAKYRWSLGAPDYAVDLDGFYAVVQDAESDTEYRVTRATIQKGVATLRQWSREPHVEGTNRCHPSYTKRILAASAMNDASEMDASDADIVVQAGLFGEIIYG